MEHFSVYVIPVMLIMNMFIILAGYVSVKLFSGKKKLRKEGFPDEYIDLSERTNRSAGNYVIVSLAVSQILGILFCLILGFDITVSFFLDRIFTGSIIFMALVLAFKYIYLDKDTRKEQRRIVTERGDKVVIDFNYDALRLILNWKLELAAFLLIIYFNMFYLENNVILYVYAGLPWYFYAMLRNLRYQVRETIRYSYRLVGILMVIYQAVKLGLFFIYFRKFMPDAVLTLGSVNLMLAALVCIIMVWTVVRGALNLPKLSRMFPKTAHNHATAV